MCSCLTTTMQVVKTCYRRYLVDIMWICTYVGPAASKWSDQCREFGDDFLTNLSFLCSNVFCSTTRCRLAHEIWKNLQCRPTSAAHELWENLTIGSPMNLVSHRWSLCGGRRGNLFFLQTHKWDNGGDQLMHGEDYKVPDPSLYGDGESWSQATFNPKGGVMLQSQTHFIYFFPTWLITYTCQSPMTWLTQIQWLICLLIIPYDITTMSLWCTLTHAYSLPTSSWLILTQIASYVCSTQTLCTSI